MLRTSLASFAMLAAVLLGGQTAPTEASITAQLKTLRQQPEDKRPGVTHQLALDIRTLPAGLPRLQLANSLANLATEGDPGKDTLADVALTLAESLDEHPLSSSADDAGGVPSPYMEVSQLIRYEHVTVDPKYLSNPLYARADALLDVNEADVAKADFTLRDLDNKKVTLSDLRGKIVLVNFWATWCPPCRKEMPDLDAIYTHFQPQGLVVLSISDEDFAKVAPFISHANYHPPVLLDPGSKVHQQFHVEGIPKSFVFDRSGKLVAQTIDQRTRRQFLNMLASAGLHD